MRLFFWEGRSKLSRIGENPSFIQAVKKRKVSAAVMGFKNVECPHSSFLVHAAVRNWKRGPQEEAFTLGAVAV